MIRWVCVSSLALVLSIALLIYLFPDTILPHISKAWCVEEKLQKADAIVVLGGGVGYRPHAAAKLWQEGWAPKILVMSPKRRDGATTSEHEATIAILVQHGVTRESIVILPQVASTLDEAHVLASWISKNSAKRVILPTDTYHTRRVNRMMRKKVEKPLGCDCIVTVSPFPFFKHEDWWKQPFGRERFGSEFLKSVYYWILY